MARDSEIRALTETSLDKFANEYYTTRKQAMIDAVDLTIRKEKQELLLRRQAELLPLSTSLSLDKARQALDEGLAETTNPANTTPHQTTQALPGASQLDPLIASLTDTIIAKINDLAVSSGAKVDKLSADLDFRLARLECKNKAMDKAAASGGGFTSARQMALIHECAIDNFEGHQLTQQAPRGWEALNRHTTNITPNTHQPDAMQTQEDYSPATRPLATTVSNFPDRMDADTAVLVMPNETNRDALQNPRPAMANTTDPNGCDPTIRPISDYQPSPTTFHTNQVQARALQAAKPSGPSYAAKAASTNQWRVVPPRKGKGKPQGQPCHRRLDCNTRRVGS
jgi:hypothetical protein